MRSDPVSEEISDYEYELSREESRYRARRGLLNFTSFTKPNYQINWHHRALCRKLNQFAEGKIKRLMVFMPPRHGKSELVSRRLPAYLLGRNPDVKIIAASHTADLAASMNRDVQRIIDGDAYRELFPETTLSGANVVTVAQGTYLRNSSEFEIVGRQGAYKSAGVGGALTGKGGDFLILDDPVKDAKEAESVVERENLWNWYTTTFSSRAEGGAGILITLTRWHENDLAGRLLALAKSDPEADQWEVLNFPAIREATENELDPREEGEALWPWKYPIESLKKTRATVGSRVFNALHQQRPSSEEGETLKRIWMTNRFKVLPSLGERRRWDQILCSSDLRFKDAKNSGDYVVNQIWARLGARFFFLGESRGRWGFTESLKEFVKIIGSTPVGQFKLSAFDEKAVENKANGPALENVLKEKVPGIVLVEPDGGKLARVNAVTPLWAAGNIWLPDDSLYPEINAIIEEWVSFGPGCAFDDRTDAMSQALHRLSNGMDDYLEQLSRM